LERGLIEAGAGDFRFLIVGCGSDGVAGAADAARPIHGRLRGEALARAYANSTCSSFLAD